MDTRKVEYKYVHEMWNSYAMHVYSHSSKLFWRGVPVRTILLFVLIWFMAIDMALLQLRRTWPSSQTTNSGPTDKRQWCVLNQGLYTVYSVEVVNRTLNEVQSLQCYIQDTLWTFNGKSLLTDSSCSRRFLERCQVDKQKLF